MIIQNDRRFDSNEIVISQRHFLRKFQLLRFFNNDITLQTAKKRKKLNFSKIFISFNLFPFDLR